MSSAVIQRMFGRALVESALFTGDVVPNARNKRPKEARMRRRDTAGPRFGRGGRLRRAPVLTTRHGKVDDHNLRAPLPLREPKVEGSTPWGERQPTAAAPLALVPTKTKPGTADCVAGGSFLEGSRKVNDRVAFGCFGQNGRGQGPRARRRQALASKVASSEARWCLTAWGRRNARPTGLLSSLPHRTFASGLSQPRSRPRPCKSRSDKLAGQLHV